MTSAQPSELDRLIPPEIKDDDFSQIIQDLARRPEIHTVLEIGSSSGTGSTEAFVKGLRENPNQPTLFCMEVSKARFAALIEHYRHDKFVRGYNVSSIARDQFPSPEAIIEFYNNTPSNLNVYPLDLVLSWLQQDIEYVENSGVPDRGIERIRQENGIDRFDMVLIDGSEFTGAIELEAVYGAKFILLDDICAFKNYHNHQRLCRDPNYALIHHNPQRRHGFSVFQRTNLDLPVHFFTIVLNGEPFIRYHLDILKQLPFRWHWHIVEGVADLKGCSAWSLPLGGRIPHEMHSNGRSVDGTTDYLDAIERSEPERVTIYRKPSGEFWDGAIEMVNAPLPNITEECLLWQVDVDELWTIEQICRMRQLFSEHPDRMAAYYWCWYFVGEQLMISSRHCYAQNPRQEWLRTWRYQPGNVWISHSPPILVEQAGGRNIASIKPFMHDETEAAGLVFQHFAYVTPDQLRLKEQYYGYKNALSRWQLLQAETRFPVRLRQYFPWVRDFTTVDRAESCGVVPIAHPVNGTWQFRLPDELQPAPVLPAVPLIAIDGVFFQLHKTGIARVWRSLLEEWAQTDFRHHLVLLDRAGTAPDIAGIRTIVIDQYRDAESDRPFLQSVCDQLGADVFISTYFTTPETTPAVLLIHDLIPEVMGENPNHPIVQAKRQAIEYASDHLAISQNTARDLVQFYPQVESVTVAYCGVSSVFSPASSETIAQFRHRYGIQKPYFLVTSADNPSPYKNNQLFFEAIAQLATKTGFEIVCTVLSPVLPDDWRDRTAGCTVHLLRLTDAELALAYGGAIALIYPSRYEGFGMPVLEAMACGCPVITCANSSIGEVGDQAVLYVPEDDAIALADALCEVQKPSVRSRLIAAGLERSPNFSWSKMAQIVQDRLIATTLPRFDRPIVLAIFPDWQQSEDLLYEELGQAIATVMTHLDQESIALLVDVSQIPDEVDADMILGNLVMHLLLETEAPEPEIVAIAPSPIQWEMLAPQIYGYLPPAASTVPKAHQLLESIEQLQTRRVRQDASGHWHLTQGES